MGLIENLYTISSIKGDIRSAIEEKGVDMTGLSFADYPGAISQISGGGGNMSTLSVSVNGTYYPEAGYDGFSEVSVNVIPNLGYGYVFSSNGVYKPEDYGYDGFAKIVVDVPGGYTEKEVTEQTYQIYNLSNSASFVHRNVFEDDDNLQTVYLPNASYIGSEAFRYCNGLISVNLPVCEIIYPSAFNQCTSLTEISIPVCKSLGVGAFQGCTSLTEISLTECQSLLSSVFNSCTSLKTAYIPYCYSMQYYAFGNCPELDSLTIGLYVYKIPAFLNKIFQNATKMNNGTGRIYVASDMYSRWIVSPGWSSYASQFVSVNQAGPVLSFDNGLVYGITKMLNSDYSKYLGITNSDVTGVSLSGIKTLSNVFMTCENITSVALDNCTSIGSSAFKGCSLLSEVSLPVCEFIGDYAFFDTVLSNVYLPVCSYLGDGVFDATYFHSFTITLGYSGVVTIPGANLFPGKFSLSIFVPTSLVNAYKAAMYWSVCSDCIFPIPE